MGTPSTEQMFEVSGNYLTEDLNISVTGEFEISAESNGTLKFIAIPSNYNATVFDASAPWTGYMNVFELPVNGGGYVFGSPWGLPPIYNQLEVLTNNSVKLMPNINTYRR